MRSAWRLAGVLLLAARVRACTVIAATAGATADGSVLVTHSDDAEGSGDPRVYRVPAAYHGHGAERPVFANAGDFRKPEVIGSIPQVGHTYAYYRTGFGMLNEKQLVLGEGTTSSISKPNDAKPVHKGGKALLGIQELTMLVMERCATARCAVETAGNLTEAYGFYQDADTPTGEALALGDTREVWLFHVLPDSTTSSSVWAGARVPDGHVTSIANMFMIRDMNLSDTDNFLASKNIEDEAERSGRWDKKSGKPIDFTHVFSDGEYMAKHYSGRRVWRALSLLAPNAGLSPDYGDMRADAPYPFSVPAGVKVTPQTLMRIHRDYYAGTPYDLTQGLAAGPWGTPNRWSMPGAALGATWERPISIYRQDLSYIAQARHWLPDACGGTLWFGPHNAQGTVYFPLPIGAEQVPAELGSFAMDSGAADRGGAFWAFSAVQQLAESRFAWISKEVRGDGAWKRGFGGGDWGRGWEDCVEERGL
jgi:dipeptidase